MSFVIQDSEMLDGCDWIFSNIRRKKIMYFAIVIDDLVKLYNCQVYVSYEYDKFTIGNFYLLRNYVLRVAVS